MSDWFYDTVTFVGRHPFWVSSRPTVIGAHHTDREGAYILASGNHEAPYDIPLLMRHCKRRIDFLSITEVFQNPLVAWLYGNMNAFPLDRSRPDSKAMLQLVDRLQRGRVLGMFPEGRFVRGEESVVKSRRIRSGVGRIAKLSNCPIVPCLVINSIAYSKFINWLPIRRVRYGVIFSEPIEPTAEPEEIERQLIDRYVLMYAQLQAAMLL